MRDGEVKDINRLSKFSFFVDKDYTKKKLLHL